MTNVALSLRNTKVTDQFLQKEKKYLLNTFDIAREEYDILKDKRQLTADLSGLEVLESALQVMRLLVAGNKPDVLAQFKQLE